jgi:hypothetical protein
LDLKIENIYLVGLRKGKGEIRSGSAKYPEHMDNIQNEESRILENQKPRIKNQESAS